MKLGWGARLIVGVSVVLFAWGVGAEGHVSWVGTDDDKFPVVVVSGTPYEMGYALGSLLDYDVAECLPNLVKHFQREDPERYSDEELDAAWDAVSPYMHERFTEELRGVAEGSGVPIEIARRAHMIPVVSDFACSSVAAWNKATSDGHLYQTRNLDWVMSARVHDYPCLVVYIPDEGVPHVNVTFAGYIGVNTGMNTAGVVLSEMGNSPGSDYPFDLDGTHFTTLFRDVLYDAECLDDAINIIQSAKRIKKYMFVVGGGQDKRAVKMRAHAPNLTIWEANDPTDMLAPDVMEDIVYEDEGRGAFEPLQEMYGKIDEESMIDICKRIPIKGGNVLDVVYDATALEMWVAYAEGPVEAYERSFVHVRLKDYVDVPSGFGGAGAIVILGLPIVLLVGLVVWILK